MRSRKPSALLLAVVFFCIPGSSSAADEFKGNELFPLSVGKRWTYRVQGQETTLVIIVTSEEQIGDFRVFRLEGRQRGAVIASEHLSIRPEGAFRMRFDGFDFDPPLLICKFPPRAELSWKMDYKIGDKKASISFEAESEVVEVPAGKFKAFVVHSTVPDGQLKNTCWYAPRVGMVKQQIESEDGKVVLELEQHDRTFQKKGPPIK